MQNLRTTSYKAEILLLRFFNQYQTYMCLFSFKRDYCTYLPRDQKPAIKSQLYISIWIPVFIVFQDYDFPINVKDFYIYPNIS